MDIDLYWMNVENTSSVDTMPTAEVSIITTPTLPLFKKGIKSAVTKVKNKVKKDSYRCELCLGRSKKANMKTCQVCKDIGMKVFNFCKRCVRQHDIVGSPYTHKAQWTVAYPEEAFQN